MLESVMEAEKGNINETKKPLIFCVTPNIKKRLFMLAEDNNADEEDRDQVCYPDCNPCNPCNPCRPGEWGKGDCYPDCNPCNPCNPCKPGEWNKKEVCYPDCNPCSPCNPCRPDER